MIAVQQPASELSTCIWNERGFYLASSTANLARQTHHPDNATHIDSCANTTVAFLSKALPNLAFHSPHNKHRWVRMLATCRCCEKSAHRLLVDPVPTAAVARVEWWSVAQRRWCGDCAALHPRRQPLVGGFTQTWQKDAYKTWLQLLVSCRHQTEML